ncbi:MAG: glutamate--tRNA ligase [Pseudomonadota bacterium]|nr:glutamate--tRNA ligase [Pseudomonadota bacterium]
MSKEKIRVRFAPSPTGSLHVGGARTALYNFLFAKKNKGDFVLRIEDTDLARSTDESLKSMVSDLEWLGLQPNEGYTITNHEKNSFGPYKQSERLDIYKDYANKLLEAGKAYYCFLTDTEIDKQKQESLANGGIFQIKSPYRDLKLTAAKELLEKNPNATIRFKIPVEKVDYVVKDLIRGEVKLPSTMVGDFVIMRSGGMPVYNFCCAIDDALMNITHVLRGEEHLSNTLRQMMIFQALELSTPQFAHLSIILNDDRKKLSKRDGDVSCSSFKDSGYLPEALLNYIALLGWTDPDGEEIFSLDDLIDKFEISSLNAAGPIFDKAKLNWVNSQHIRKLTTTELLSRLRPILNENDIYLTQDEDWQKQAIELIQTELVTLHDAISPLKALTSNELDFEEAAKEALSWDTSKAVVAKWQELLAATESEFITQEEVKSLLKKIQVECAVKGKLLFMPLRSIIIGKAHGYDLKTLIPLIKVSDLKLRASAIST